MIGWMLMLVVFLAFIVFNVAALWTVFVKASQPGWAALIPIYNYIVLLRIAGRPWWWVFLLLIPLVNFVFLIIIAIDVAKNFGTSVGFGVGLAFLPSIFYPILAWNDHDYQPQAA